MRKSILVTTSALSTTDSYRSELIRELCGVNSGDWSSREMKLMNSAMEHGEVYPMVIEISESPIFTRFTTDLGQPEDKLIVIIHTKFTEERRIKAAELVQLLAEGLGS